MAHKQLELPLAIAIVETGIAHDPYWDELERGDTVEPNTNIALEHSPAVLEQVPNYVEVAPQHLRPPYESVGAQVADYTEKFAPQHDTPTQWIEKYWVERGAKKYWYYRYCWIEGRKKHRRYIGSVKSAAAKDKKKIVENAIAAGRLPQEIKQLLAKCPHTPPSA